MDSRQIRYFASIFENGTLTGAAAQERVAVSALSHHLANMEAELGTRLFVRRPRGMEPTAAGMRLYEHARSILKAMSTAERDIRQAADEVSGDVSIGLAYSAVKAIGVPLMQRVVESYPKLRISLTESLSGMSFVHLMSSEVDLALVFNPPADARLKIEPVLEEKMVCVGRSDIIGDTESPITFDEVLDLPVIILRRGISARALMNDVTLLKRLEACAKFQINSVHAIGGCLVAGLGCVIGTKLFMRDYLERGELHYRPIVGPELSRTLYVCELADRPPTFALEAVRTLILGLVARAVAEGTWEATPLASVLDRAAS
jgi:LysR family nitrogen assimilation transcriptional regulator